MKIQRVELNGVAGVPDLTIELPVGASGEPAALVAVTGPSGAGKTRLLEVLIAAKEAIRPYGQLAPGASWIRSEGAAKARVTFYLDEAEREFGGTAASLVPCEIILRPNRVDVEADDALRAVLGRYTHQPAHGKVDYFPSERRVTTFPPFAGLGTAEQRLLRLGKDARKYGFILPFLQSLAFEPARRARFEAGLAALSPRLRYVAPAAEQAIPRCFATRSAEGLTLAQLSSGEADAVIFAATAAAISLDHSLVFVDRPDLHADEPAQRLEALGSLGRDNQLWVTCAEGAVPHGAHVVKLRA